MYVCTIYVRDTVTYMFPLNGVYHTETKCSKDSYKYMSSRDLALHIPSHGIDYYPPPRKELPIETEKHFQMTHKRYFTLFLLEILPPLRHFCFSMKTVHEHCPKYPLSILFS